MKSKAQVVRENSHLKTLINAVINRIGLDSVSDINNHGIDGGFSGFIYFSETTAFFRRHRKAILDIASEMADSSMFGGVLEMIQGFRCLDNGVGQPFYSVTEIGEAIFGNSGECCDTIQNAMAWFAAEEVCRMFEG